MRITAKSDYAVRAVVELARGSGDGTDAGPGACEPVSAEALGKAQHIPHGFLQAILADLRRAGFVTSQRGASGGWRLAQDPARISIADVIRSIDGPLVSVHGVRPEQVTYNSSTVPLQHVWIAARSSLREVLESVSVADLAAGVLPTEIRRRAETDDAWSAR